MRVALRLAKTAATAVAAAAAVLSLAQAAYAAPWPTEAGSDVLQADAAEASLTSTTIPTEAPTLAYPGTGVIVSSNPVLRWLTLPGALKYRVQVSRSSSFSTLLVNVDTYALRATPTIDLPVGPLYWRVAGTNGGTGVGPFAVGEFTRNAAKAPTLSAPANDTVLSYPDQPPVLRWSALPSVKSYRVEVDDADDFIGAQVYPTVNTSYALTEPLILAKTYFWRVQGVSDSGVTGEYSSTWRFRVEWPAPAGKPVLSTPANSTGTEVTDVVFRWYPVPGAKSYQIQVSPNPLFDNNITDDRIVKGTQYSPAATYNNANYYWRVRAIDTGTTAHQGPWSDSWQFRRAWTERPVPTAPIGGVSSGAQRFEWAGVKNAGYYEIQIAMDANFSSYVARCGSFGTALTPNEVTSDVAGTVYPPAGTSTTSVKNCSFALSPGTRYFWRVRGVDTPAQVYGVFSETAEFVYYRGVATLTGPADGATTSVPVLTWEPVAGYSQYEVTIMPDAGGSLTKVTTFAHSFTPAKLVPGGYQWNVVGKNTDGIYGVRPNGATNRRFTVVDQVPAGSLEPLSVSEDNSVTAPSMRWQPIAGAAYYKVFGGLDSDPVDTLLSGTNRLTFPAFTLWDTTKTPGAYKWRVEAYNASDQAFAWSGYGHFTIADLEFATYVSPANCTSQSCPGTEPKTPELRWNAVQDASFYRVWVALDENFTNIVRGYETLETSLAPRESYADNEAGQSYYWFVQPCVGNRKSVATVSCGEFGGASLLERARAFRKQSVPVVQVAPLNQVDPNIVDVVSFQWQDYSQTTANILGVKRYRVQVATDSAFTTVVDDVLVDQPYYQAWAKSYPDGVYYWRAQAIDGGDIPLAFSPAWRFQKSSLAPNPIATAATTGLPTLGWGALPYASGYTVEVYKGTSALFPSANRVLSATAKQPSYTPAAALPAGTYSWRVRKLNPDGDGGLWSSGMPTFTVAAPTPTLSSPADLTQVKTNDLIFSWQAVPGAASYLFEASASSAFSQLTDRSETVMTAWAPTKLYSDGATYYWRIRVLDGSENVLATSLVRRVVKDALPPTVSRVSPTTGLAVDGTVTVTFDEPVKGVSAAGLALRVAGTTTAVSGVVSPSPTTETSAATFKPTKALLPGQYYELIVGSGITDTLGNPMAISTTKLRTAVTFENTSPALGRTWDADLSSSASGGRYLSSNVSGATASFRFSGSSVSVLGRLSPNGGYADVYLDGVKQPNQISFYGSSTAYKRAVFGATGLSSGSHVIKVRVAGTRPAASKGNFVELDAFVAGSTYEESSSAVTTDFARRSAPEASGGSYDMVNQDDGSERAMYRFAFRGTGFTLYATRLASGGAADVYIDGVKVGTASFYAATTGYKTAAFSSRTLADGAHTVQIIASNVKPEKSTGTYVTFDSVTVR